jgi:SAM-dependent methyltransferase
MADQEPAIDVSGLVEDLRRSAAAARSNGMYGDDVGAGPVEPADLPRVRFRPELGYSSKPVVGRPITGVKRTLLRLQHHVLDDLARQTDAAITTTDAQLGQMASDLQALVDRVTDMENSLQRLQIGPRLARVERSQRSDRQPAAEAAAADPSAPRADDAPTTMALDYLAFEARFRGSEELIRERQQTYMELLLSRRRVIDVGCGRGELLTLLREKGIDAYGVDTEPDFVARCREAELDVKEEDGVAHLASLSPGEVDAVVASHVAEHLSPQRLTRLIQAAHDALEPGGILILETPNPESLLAGSVNFHRDPTHIRPIHPDTLAFLCESTGFEPVEIWRLSPVPEAERLPRAPDGAAGAEHLNSVVDQLNELLYGFQDYAVVATRAS